MPELFPSSTKMNWLPIPENFRSNLKAALEIGDPDERLERLTALRDAEAALRLAVVDPNAFLVTLFSVPRNRVPDHAEEIARVGSDLLLGRAEAPVAGLSSLFAEPSAATAWEAAWPNLLKAASADGVRPTLMAALEGMSFLARFGTTSLSVVRASI